MTFITARELRLKPAAVWKKLKQAGELVVTVNGRPCAILTNTSPESFTESLMLLKRARAEQAASKLRRQAVKQGTHRLALPAITKEIRAVRRTAQ